MTAEDLGAMNLAGNSNDEFSSCEMDDSVAQNDAVVTFTNHAGPVCIGHSHVLLHPVHCCQLY